MIFNEDKLQEEIIKTWGEFGVHNEVFKAMRKQISAEKQCDIHGAVCCGVLEKMKLEWMQLEDGTRCMPFIYGIGQKMCRVNNCPSCGKDVRDVMILPTADELRVLIDNNNVTKNK